MLYYEVFSNLPRLGASGFKGRYTDRGLKVWGKNRKSFYHSESFNASVSILLSHPKLLEAIFFIDTIP